MKKRKRLLVILSTFVMAAQPLCVAAEMQDAEGFGAVEEIWADEENEEEFSAAPEGGNEDLNGFLLFSENCHSGSFRCFFL